MSSVSALLIQSAFIESFLLTDNDGNKCPIISHIGTVLQAKFECGCDGSGCAQ